MNETTNDVDPTKSTTFKENDVKSTGDSNAKTSNVESSGMDETNKSLNDSGMSEANSSKGKGWVQFEDDDDDNKISKETKIPQMENVDLSDKVNNQFV